MTDLDALLLQLGSPQRPTGPIVVCQGHQEQPDETPARFRAAEILGARVMLAEGQHTGEEARWIVAHADDTVTVVTHGYHVPRVFLTLVKALQDAEREFQLRVYVVGVSGNDHKWASEQQKIAQYQAAGQVASYAEGLKYLAWRDQ